MKCNDFWIFFIVEFSIWFSNPIKDMLMLSLADARKKTPVANFHLQLENIELTREEQETRNHRFSHPFWKSRTPNKFPTLRQAKHGADAASKTVQIEKRPYPFRTIQGENQITHGDLFKVKH